MCCTQETSILELFGQISNIAIAILSFLFAIYIFYFRNRKDDKKEEKNRKNDRIQTIIFEHNLGKLFIFFYNLSSKTKELKTEDISINDKSRINDEIIDELNDLRLKFTDLLLAVDVKLYDDIKSLLDELVDCLTESIFNEGVNLSYKPKFEELIEKPISTYKTDIIKVLYEY
tara:strand:- start:214 stop:732 length:519 start_codon:yes stop_codon:yes gene_type:complete